MSLENDILALAEAHGAQRGDYDQQYSEQVDLLGVFGWDGQDATDFLEDFFDRFEVDYSDFRWEFHYNADEPPYFRRVVPIGEDGREIPYLGITLPMLVQAAKQQKWQVQYPPHKLVVRYRNYNWLAWVILAVSVLVLAYSAVMVAQ